MTSELADDKNCHHFVMTPLESHDDEDSLSQSTGSYSVKLSATPLTEDDLNVVKKSATGLEHVSIRLLAVMLTFFFISYYSSP